MTFTPAELRRLALADRAERIAVPSRFCRRAARDARGNRGRRRRRFARAQHDADQTAIILRYLNSTMDPRSP